MRDADGKQRCEILHVVSNSQAGGDDEDDKQAEGMTVDEAEGYSWLVT